MSRALSTILALRISSLYPVSILRSSRHSLCSFSSGFWGKAPFLCCVDHGCIDRTVHGFCRRGSGGGVGQPLWGPGISRCAAGPQAGRVNTLAFVAALMAMFDPHVLWDVGFQLSFMATLGLLLYGEPLTKGFIRLASPRLSMETARRTARPVTSIYW